MKHTPIRKTVDLDAYYANRPDTRPAMRWPVLGRIPNGFGPIAVFFDYYDAVDFVNANLPERNLYIGEPSYAPKPYSELKSEMRTQWL